MIFCAICRNETTNKKYCSVECQYEGYRKTYKKAEKVKRICLNCNIEFEIKKSRLKYGGGKCCCRKCVDEYHKKTYLGENNPQYRKILSNEQKLQKSIFMKELWQNGNHRKNVLNGQIKFFAKMGYWCGTDKNSKEKRKRTFLEKFGVEHNWSSPEVRKKCEETCIERYGETSLEIASRALHNTKYTKIEKIVENILIKNKIDFKRGFKIVYKQDPIRFKVYDFLVNRILIEVDGDYWQWQY